MGTSEGMNLIDSDVLIDIQRDNPAIPFWRDLWLPLTASLLV
jgi:hypothetical protein